MLKRGVKGSITIFCLLLAMSVIVLITSLFDILRLYYAVSTFSGYSAEAISAVMNSPTDDYRKTIGFSFIGDSEQEIGNRLKNNFERLHAGEEILGVSLSVEPVVQGVFLTDSPETAYLAVQDFTAFNLSKADYNRCEESIYEFCIKAREINKEISLLESINHAAYDISEPGMEDGFLGYWYQEIPNRATVAEGKYSRRFSRKMMRWCGDSRMTEDRFLTNKGTISLLDSAEAAVYYGTEVLAGYPVFQWYNCNAYAAYSEWFQRIINLMVYSDVFLTDASNGRAGKSGLTGEYEYLLYGDSSDRWNIAKVCEQIMYLRYAFNLYTIATDEDLLEMLDADESTRNKQMVAWAIRESIYDVKTLFAGYRVPTIKTGNQFATMFDTDVSEIVSGTGTDGRSYREYLWELSLYSVSSRQIVCSETMYARWIDWILYVTGIDAETTPLMATCYLQLEIGYEPVSIAGAMIDLEDIGCLDFVLKTGNQP